jgi:TolA-binding protein
MASPINSPPATSLEEQDLKRIRNTAASARFRAKKKRREQSLDRSAKEKKEKLQTLENRINELELENQWLKDLIMEKKDNRASMAELRKNHGRDGKDGSDADDGGPRTEDERTDGVGT